MGLKKWPGYNKTIEIDVFLNQTMKRLSLWPIHSQNATFKVIRNSA